ncbi:MAG: SurA N-terminal domain-containing protein [Desulfobacteraceae bacterium]|nr:SurA N-terminal domain-containing protein [Desulfobacteraceae bacterium]
MRFWNKAAVLGCILFGCVLLQGNGVRGEVIDRVVANVNGDIILYSDLQEQIKTMEKLARGATIDESKRPELEREVLNQLIRQKLAEQETKRLKIMVSNTEVDQTIENIMKENKLSKPQFEQVLQQSGQTFDKFRQGVKKELERDRLLERVLKSKVIVTNEQVDAYLKSLGESSSLSANRMRLGLIFLPADDKNVKFADMEKKGREALDKLKGGAEFQKMARDYSKGPAAQEGGDIGFIEPDELAPYISSAVKNLKKGEISGLIRGPNGYYIVKVFDIEQQKKDKSDPTLREKARRELYQKEVNRKFEDWVKNLESKSFIQSSL